MTLPSSDSENFQYNVIINADQALASLLRLTNGINSFDEKVTAVTQQVAQWSAQTGESVDTIVAKVQALDVAFSDVAGKSLLFGGASGSEGWGAVNEQLQEYSANLQMVAQIQQQSFREGIDVGNAYTGLLTGQQEQLGELATDEATYATRIAEVTGQTQGMAGATQVAAEAQGSLAAGEQEVATGAEKVAGGFNIIRTALGVLEAMFIFNMIQAVTTFFTNAINYANEYYQSLLNISVAQDAMARAGISTTQQDLLNTAKDLEQTWGVFANKDMVNAVAQAGMLGSQYGFSQQQISQIVNMAAALSIQQGNIQNLGTNVEQIIRSIESGSVPAALKEWGVGFDANALKAEAIRLGLVKEGQTLSGNAKAIATESLLWQEMSGRVQEMGQYQNTVAGGADQMASRWTDFLTKLGQLFAPLRELFQNIFVDSLNGAIAGVQKLQEFYTNLWAVIIAGFETVNQLITGQISLFNNLNDAIAKNIQSAQQLVGSLMQTGGVSTSNTPVNPNAPSPSMTTAPKPLTNTQMDAAAKDYQNYYDQLTKDTQSYNQQIQDLTDQYNLNVQKEIENYDKSVAQEKQNFRLKEIQAEEAYQQKLRELNATYQIDLEDALRKRDALAVLKLMEKHQNELTTAKQQEQLRIQQDQQAEKVRLQQMKQDEQLRLQQLAQEYELTKQKDAQHYQQQIQDLKTSLDQKLQEEAVSIGQEYGLNQDGINALYELFKEYYGSDGTFAQLQNESYIQMINQSTQFVEAMQKIISQYANTIGQMSSMLGTAIGKGGITRGASAGGISDSGLGGGGRRYAQGGIALAQSATNAVFGEAGPELAMFLPLNRNPSSMSTSGLGGLLGGSAQGAIQILLSLDPDLEARIMNNTLNQAANVIVQTYGSR